MELGGDAALASGDGSSSQIIFDAEAIASLVDGKVARPIPMDIFLDILKRFRTHISHVNNDELQSPFLQDLRSGRSSGESFLDSNATFIKDTVSAAQRILNPEGHL